MFEKLSSSVYMLYTLINNFYGNFVMGFRTFHATRAQRYMYVYYETLFKLRILESNNRRRLS